MRLRHLSILVVALALSACGSPEDAAPTPETDTSEVAAAPDIVVEGPERRILAFGDSLFAGYRLEEQEGYPEQLEDALREGGINARVIDAGVSGDTSAAGLQRLAFTLDAQEVKPDLVIIDSIQTMWADNVGSAPGSVSQVRAAAHELTSFAKRKGMSVILVGHVTKDGQIAGPRVVEHMVDTVLYFEGERGHQFRILRAVKNRFGPADEIGVFEMTGGGLSEVANPSALFLSDREDPAPGATVFAGIEGTRPVLVEFQCLVAPSPLSQPRRSVLGWDGGRLAMILAVLEARCGIPFAGLDVYLNVAGGMKVSEPAADLAVAAALLSAREDAALPPETGVFGEISLSGSLRPVGQSENRLKEARKLGFSKAILPEGGKAAASGGMALTRMPDLTAFVGDVFGAG